MALTAELLESSWAPSDIRSELNQSFKLRVVEGLKQAMPKLDTTGSIKSLPENASKLDLVESEQFNSGTQLLDLEAEYYCVASSIDATDKVIEARVYDINSNTHIMNIDVPFDEFSVDDQLLIKPNAIFYWRIGTKTTIKFNKKKTAISKQNTTFSSFLMRRVFTRRRFHQNKIDKRVSLLKTMFS